MAAEWVVPQSMRELGSVWLKGQNFTSDADLVKYTLI